MSKSYNARYLLANPVTHECGDMVCESCGETIDGKVDDWKSAQRVFDKRGRWRYVNHHRKCVSDQEGWCKLAYEARAKGLRVALLSESLREHVDVNGSLSDDLYAALDKLGADIDAYLLNRN